MSSSTERALLQNPRRAMISSTTGSMASVRRTVDVKNESVFAARAQEERREREDAQWVPSKSRMSCCTGLEYRSTSTTCHSPCSRAIRRSSSLHRCMRGPVRQSLRPTSGGKVGRVKKRSERGFWVGQVRSRSASSCSRASTCLTHCDVRGHLKHAGCEPCRQRGGGGRKILVSFRALAARSAERERGLTVLSVIESNWSK